MEENVEFRQATIDDTEELVELRKVLLSGGDTHYASKNEKDELAWQQAYRGWIKENVENENVLILVGEDKKDNSICACIIGIIDLRAPMIGALNGKVGWGQTCIVREDKRGTGIAEIMSNHFDNWFKEKGVHKIVAESSKMAEKFNNRMGYKLTGEQLIIKAID